jgi:hypothetical protein
MEPLGGRVAMTPQITPVALGVDDVERAVALDRDGLALATDLDA